MSTKMGALHAKACAPATRLTCCSQNPNGIRAWVTPHIRTTDYWCDPKLFSELYPEPITSRISGGGGLRNGGDRYAFEHGERSLTSRFIESGRQAWLVTWTNAYPPEKWIDLRELQWAPEQQGNLLAARQVDGTIQGLQPLPGSQQRSSLRVGGRASGQTLR